MAVGWWKVVRVEHERRLAVQQLRQVVGRLCQDAAVQRQPENEPARGPRATERGRHQEAQRCV